MIHTIIVEDDPMVAQINCQYLQRLEDFQVDAVFGSGKAALDYVRGNSADLLILDVYMPGLSGLELLYQIRTEHIRLSAIMVTGAIEMETVEEALRLGIVDYLIKPFSFQRFQEAIEKYLLKMNLLKTCQTANQTVVDQLMHTSFSHDKESKELRKGLNQKTLDYIFRYLKEHPRQKHTCESLSRVSGLSKVTVRRYLNYLIEVDQAVSSIDYETGGRPRVLYRLR